MAKTLLLAPALALALAFPASAMTDAKPTNQITRGHGLNAEVVEVQSRPSPVGVIARDAIGGAVAGAAVGGGVVLYRHYVTNNGNGDWGNWQRDIAIGAGIGLAVGLVFGAVDAASSADHVFNGPVADRRDVGFSPPTYLRRSGSRRRIEQSVRAARARPPDSRPSRPKARGSPTQALAGLCVFRERSIPRGGLR